MRESRVWRIRNWISTPWLIQSDIVLIIRGAADCGTAFSAIRRCSEPMDIAMTLAFLVAHPMNTGRRRS